VDVPNPAEDHQSSHTQVDDPARANKLLATDHGWAERAMADSISSRLRWQAGLNLQSV